MLLPQPTEGLKMALFDAGVGMTAIRWPDVFWICNHSFPVPHSF